MRGSRIAVCVAFFLLTACDDVPVTGKRPQQSAADSVVLDSAQSRQLAEWVCDEDTAQVDSLLAQALSGSPVLEREVHDCQRMIVQGEYGPLVGVFPYHPTMALPVDSFSTWRRVAVVVNWGGGGGAETYSALHLAKGAHCLLLQRDSTVWRALMSPMSAGCMAHAGRPLSVVAQEYLGDRTGRRDPLPHPPGLQRVSYPATARFRWHSRAREYAIGVKCGNRWCTIGSQTAVSALPELRGPMLTTLPGYFDEQPLAVFDSARGRLVPGPLGRIYPSGELARLNTEAESAAWSQARGYASFEVRSAGASVPHFDTYVRKLGLATDPTGRIATGELWLNAAGETAETRAGGAVHPAARVAVVRNEHHSAQGTVRWRWLERDEAAWVPCQKDNCCTASF